MDYRRLGASGLRVPVLSFGTATFGGGAGPTRDVGNTDIAGATRLVDICLEHGVSLFDSADIYSAGKAEEILGAAIKGRRDKVLISTKAAFRTGRGPNDYGASRRHLVETVEASLRRLGTDRIDLFQLHGPDYNTPLEETLAALDQLVRQGKILYLGASNFSGWHLMKMLGIADQRGLSRPIAHQAYYSLLCRDYEWDLMPLAQDQGVGAVVWSPLGLGKLTGKIRRGQPAAPGTRAHDVTDLGPHVDDEHLFRIVDALDVVAEQTGKTVPQVALNWLLARPTVSTLIIGARNEDQLVANIGALGWSLTPEQTAILDDVSAPTVPYPNWHQHTFPYMNEARPRPKKAQG